MLKRRFGGQFSVLQRNQLAEKILFLKVTLRAIKDL